MSGFKFPLIAFLFISTFGYGIGVGLYQWFPFDEIRVLKNVLVSTENNNTDLSIPQEISTINKPLTADEGVELRLRLLQALAPANELSVSITPDAGFATLKTTYYGLTVRGEFYKAASKYKCLRIYIQGHGGNPNDFNYHNELREEFISDGCDVLSMSMIGLGLNAGVASFPTRFGIMNLNKEQATNHGNYSFFYDEENSDLDALSLFLYPHMRLIEHVVKQSEYQHKSIMGISGGGWYAVWLGALMPMLDTSVSYAGSLPLAYRNDAEHHGDWEQVYSPMYREVSYLQLYQLMLQDKFGANTRQAVLVYNDNDSCCFMNPAAYDFKTRIAGLEFYPSVLIDESSSHSMNVSIVRDLLKHE